MLCRYLHHHATPHIIHRDIKASNVLLDSNFEAKVADFGFARLIPDGATHVTTNVKGTLGYLAPEYAMLGKASESCDVYSYGILLLEIVSGRRALQRFNPTSNGSIADWAFPLAREKNFKEIADPKLNGNFVAEELKRSVLVALACAQKEPENRLTMLEVVELLKGEVKDKLTNLEDKLFKSWQSADDKDEIKECHGDSTSEEKDSKSEPKVADASSEEKDSKPETKVGDSGSEGALDR